MFFKQKPLSTENFQVPYLSPKLLKLFESFIHPFEIHRFLLCVKIKLLPKKKTKY